MELTAAVSIIGAVVAPFIIALIVRPTWSSERKRLVTIAVCVVIGAAVAVATGQIDTTATIRAWVARILLGVGVVTSLAQGFYQALKDPVSAVSTATSPASEDPAPRHAIDDQG